MDKEIVFSHLVSEAFLQLADAYQLLPVNVERNRICYKGDFSRVCFTYDENISHEIVVEFTFRGADDKNIYFTLEEVLDLRMIKGPRSFQSPTYSESLSHLLSVICGILADNCADLLAGQRDAYISVIELRHARAANDDEAKKMAKDLVKAEAAWNVGDFMAVVHILAKWKGKLPKPLDGKLEYSMRKVGIKRKP